MDGSRKALEIRSAFDRQEYPHHGNRLLGNNTDVDLAGSGCIDRTGRPQATARATATAPSPRKGADSYKHTYFTGVEAIQVL
jgi:hypothetical protein